MSWLIAGSIAKSLNTDQLLAAPPTGLERATPESANQLHADVGCYNMLFNLMPQIEEEIVPKSLAHVASLARRVLSNYDKEPVED